MAKAMVLALRPLLSTLVSKLQSAFQDGRYIGENIQLVQDTIAYLNERNLPGVMVFCDQDNAYPRVNWDFLQQVMGTMRVHEDFRNMVKCMYTNTEVNVKINGHTGSGFQPKNGLAQGCPLSPLLYLLYFQSFLSLLNKPGDQPKPKGVEIPGPGGDSNNPSELVAAAFADDAMVALETEDELPHFKNLLNIYEDGADALNSWPKTFAMRVGSLRESDHLPEGWEEGRDIITNTTDIRYLGIFLGTAENVAKRWHDKVTAKIRERYTRWTAAGTPKTIGGRNIVIKSSVMALAWFLVQHQIPPDFDHMMEVWYKNTWEFFEVGSTSTANQAPPGNRNRRGRQSTAAGVQREGPCKDSTQNPHTGLL